ncbi:MAG: hypothetical protein ABIQ01_00370 [Pseudolysinimonas sp.]
MDITQILEDSLRKAAAAHGVYEAEQLGGVYDEQWPAWYAAHMTKQLADDGYLISGGALDA